MLEELAMIVVVLGVVALFMLFGRLVEWVVKDKDDYGH